MKLKSYNAPYIRFHESNKTIMGDVVLVLLFIYLMTFYYYGLRTLMLAAVSVATALICDWFCSLLCFRHINIRDYSPVVTGLIIPLVLPASISYTVIVVAVAFAILIAKGPFGGVGQNLFNPAAAGVAFVTICFGSQIFLYPEPFANLEIFGDVTAKLVQASTYTLKLGGIPPVETIEMILGNFSGPMGATNILVIIACFFYLVCRNTVRWHLSVSFVATVLAIAYVFPRGPMSSMQSVVHELCSGIILFGAVFLISDPVTSPKRDSSKIVYGVFSGCVVMLFRRFGGFEEGMIFALLFVNGISPVIDVVSERVHSIVRRKRFEAKKT